MKTTIGRGVNLRSVGRRRRLFNRLAAATIALTIVGCGHGSSVTINGALTEHGTCDSLIFLQGGTPLDHLQMTFRDQGGAVIGTTSSGAGSLDHPPPYSLADQCTLSSPYTLSVPKEDFYQLDITGISQQPQPVSYDQLQRQGFRYDLQISTG